MVFEKLWPTIALYLHSLLMHTVRMRVKPGYYALVYIRTGLPGSANSHKYGYDTISECYLCNL